MDMRRKYLDDYGAYSDEPLKIKDYLIIAFTVIVAIAFCVLFAYVLTKHEQNFLKENATDIYNNYLADSKAFDEYGAITVIIADKKENYYVFTCLSDPPALYDYNGNYDKSHNGQIHGFRIVGNGCRYSAEELLADVCNEGTDITDISDYIFGADKPSNVVYTVAGEVKASSRKEIPLSR